MLRLDYSAHCVLPDGSPLLAVVETRLVRRWFRTFEVSETCTYVLKGGSWWGREGAVQRGDPKHFRLCEIAMAQVARGAVSEAVGL